MVWPPACSQHGRRAVNGRCLLFPELATPATRYAPAVSRSSVPGLDGSPMLQIHSPGRTRAYPIPAAYWLVRRRGGPPAAPSSESQLPAYPRGVGGLGRRDQSRSGLDRASRFRTA